MPHTEPPALYSVPQGSYTSSTDIQQNVSLETATQVYEDLQEFFEGAVAIQDDEGL
jgi:hypothetical protein